MDKNLKLFLDLIKYCEGTDKKPNPYAVMVGYAFEIKDFSKHPNQKIWIKSINDYSTAAGAYQFLFKTWESLRIKLNLKDFSPQSQDLGAIELIKQRNAYNDVINGNFLDAVNKCAPIWASMPFTKRTSFNGKIFEAGQGAYGQPIKTIFQIQTFLNLEKTKKKSTFISCPSCNHNFTI
jgi:muramidase (phage lysozyme)